MVEGAAGRGVGLLELAFELERRSCPQQQGVGVRDEVGRVSDNVRCLMLRRLEDVVEAQRPRPAE